MNSASICLVDFAESCLVQTIKDLEKVFFRLFSKFKFFSGLIVNEEASLLNRSFHFKCAGWRYYRCFIVSQDNKRNPKLIMQQEKWIKFFTQI